MTGKTLTKPAPPADTPGPIRERPDVRGRRQEGKGRARKGRLEDLLGYHLRRAEVWAFQSFGAALAKDRVSPGQLGVLLTVEANPGINQTRVGKALGIDRSTLVAMIDGLEGRNLLARTQSPSDRRSHALILTATGERFLDDLSPRLEAHERELVRNMSAEERAVLIDLLSRIVVD